MGCEGAKKPPDNRKQSDPEDVSGTNRASVTEPTKDPDNSGGGTDRSRSGPVGGRKHAVGNVDNATSVSDIKTKFDKESSNAAATAGAAA